MPGILEFEMELSRKQIIAAAEQKLSRPLTDQERAGIHNINSILRLKSCGQAFVSPDYTPAQVLADLAAFAREPN